MVFRKHASGNNFPIIDSNPLYNNNVIWKEVSSCSTILLLNSASCSHIISTVFAYNAWSRLFVMNEICKILQNKLRFCEIFNFFSIADTYDSPDSKGREGTIFYSTLPLHQLTNIQTFFLQHCMWDDYNIFLTQRLRLSGFCICRITIWLIDDVMIIFVCLRDDLILGFCYSNLTWETGRLELTSTITLVLQANRLTR